MLSSNSHFIGKESTCYLLFYCLMCLEVVSFLGDSSPWPCLLLLLDRGKFHDRISGFTIFIDLFKEPNTKIQHLRRTGI